MARRPDPVDATKSIYNDEELIKENHRQKLLTLESSQRHVILSYPQDLTDDELIELTAYLLAGFRRQLPPRIATIMRPT